jgi:hypothetical protein
MILTTSIRFTSIIIIITDVSARVGCLKKIALDMVIILMVWYGEFQMDSGFRKWYMVVQYFGLFPYIFGTYVGIY